MRAPTIRSCAPESFDENTGIILLHIDIGDKAGCRVVRVEADCGESAVLLACTR